MLTVPEAAKRTRKNPETIRRWIRDRKLKATRIGTQYLVDEAELEALLGTSEVLPAPAEWDQTTTGEPMPNWVAVIRQQRSEH